MKSHGSHGGGFGTQTEPQTKKSRAQATMQQAQDRQRTGNGHTSIMTCSAGDDTVSVIIFPQSPLLNCRVA